MGFAFRVGTDVQLRSCPFTFHDYGGRGRGAIARRCFVVVEPVENADQGLRSGRIYVIWGELIQVLQPRPTPGRFVPATPGPPSPKPVERGR
jgi:hypothetical protein